MLLGRVIGMRYFAASVFRPESVHTHARQSHGCLAVAQPRGERTIDPWDADDNCDRCTRNLEFRKRGVKFFCALVKKLRAAKQ